jgi:rfaE bifunctional protein kinase chain/domain
MRKNHFPSNFASRCSLLLKKITKLNLMVAGDLVADEAIYGDTERISREAPVLILRYTHTELTPGGAANAANNAADLRAQVFPLGVVGEDDQGARLLHYFKGRRVDTTGILQVKNRPTTVKSRIMAGAHHTAKQQVIRIDRLEDKEISRAVEAKLVGRITAMASRMDALLISDYGLGVLTETVRRSLLSAFAGKIITVDSRHQLGEYQGVTLITPNVSEAGPAAGIEIVDEDSLFKAGTALQERLGCQVLITQGPQGMTLFGENDEKIQLPVFGPDQPVDPTGAGDTVAVAATLSLASGADLLTAGALATVAAGIVVGKRGTATTTPDEILKALKPK